MGKTRGFTLIELMVTIAIFVIIAMMAVPSFSEIIRHNQLVDGAHDLEQRLQELRSTALLKQRDQNLALDTNSSEAWLPRKELKWSSTPPATVTYNMMGLLNSPVNLCFILEHKEDRHLKAVIIARRSGLVSYDKYRSDCSGLGVD
ncbi:Tfp pilus assembly protein FimT/FimU [Acinetobacter courvalinii]|uniref:pilus assembly FimT family protein n=1 Tax=Acinetobacter courvalinii TaxID=280147 RepID=UPI003A83C142